jgi:vitamin B12 transporter
VTVITSKDLKNSVYHNVGEVLNAQAGIYLVGAQQTPGTNQNIFMRGMNSNQTVIMIDGVRITDPSGINNAPDLSEISLMNIDRIEIVRGSHGTMFGSSAIGGVINIITKKGDKKGISAGVDVYGGTFGKSTSTLTENVYLNYQLKKGFYLSGEIFNQNVNGLDATTDTVTVPNAFKNRDKDNFDKLDYVLKTGYRGKNLNGSFAFKNSNQQTDIDKGSFSDDDNYTLDFNRKLFSGDLNYFFNDKVSVHYSGGYNSMIRKSNNDSSLVAANVYDGFMSRDEYTGEILSNDLYFHFKNQKLKFTAGANHYLEKMNNKNYIFSRSMWGIYENDADLDSLDLNLSTVSGYLQTELNGSILGEKAKNFSLLTGLRFNNNSFFGNAMTFEINPSYKTGNGLVYFSYSTGFNTPSLYQLKCPDLFYLVGNDSLKAENSSSFEFGIKQNINKKTTIELSVFHNEVKDAITYVYLWNKDVDIDSLQWYDQITSTYINAGKLITNGIEMNIHSEISDCFSVSANLSLINGRLVYDPNDIDQESTDGHHVQLENGNFLTEETEMIGLLRRPSTANVSFHWKPAQKWMISGTIRQVGSRTDVYYDTNIGALANLTVSDYTLIDLGLNFRMNEKFDMRLRMENILDTEYNEIRGYNTRGRGIYFGLNLKI